MTRNSESFLKANKEYLLLSTVYDAKFNGAGLKFLDIEQGKVVYITDPFHHEPYCLSFESRDELEGRNIPPSTIKRIEIIKKRDLLQDKDVTLAQIITPTPSEVPKVREILGETWESRIKYHRNWIYDNELIPGRSYFWNPEETCFQISHSKGSGLEVPKQLMDQLGNYGDLLENFLPDFTQEIPEIPIVACDIETEYAVDQIPQATDPRYRITCICFADNNDQSIALVLEREGIEKGVKSQDTSFSGEIQFFTDESLLISEAFDIIGKYPICVTFNGDNFDFPYLHERAKVLKVKNINPILWNRRNRECTLRNGIHIDIYRFYRNVAIRAYAFGNKYREGNLDSIASALLGTGKIQLEKEIKDLTEWELIYYCSRDAKITLDLLLFDNKTPLNLIFILSRITRTPIDDLTRTAVSNWVQSLFYSEHRRKNYLIPNSEDIQKQKGVFRSSEAIIKGKKYKGAIVIDPVPGIHFNVTVLDFACLDEDTEILTDVGWKNREKIDENDHVLTLNTNTNNLEYNSVQKKYEYDYSGEMYHLDTQSIDQFITPNHRILYFERDRSREARDKMQWKKFVSVSEARTLDQYWYSIPYTGEWARKKREVYELNGTTLEMNSFLAFYGIFLSDGGLSSNLRAVQIFQSKEPELTKMRKIVISFCQKNGFNFTENEYQSGQGNKYTILSINNKKLALFFAKLLDNNPHNPHSRFINRDILLLNRGQLQILWDSLMLGDGGKGKYKGKECYRNYSSVSKQLVDDVQEISIKLGIGAKVLKEKRNPAAFGHTYKNHISYRVFFSYERRNVVSRQNNPIHSHLYSGKVWCVSTNNGTIMIRRNGKVSITGNSLYPSIIGAFNLSYETILCSHPSCKDNKVPQTPYWVCKEKRGVIADTIGFIKDIRVHWLKPESKQDSSKKDFYGILEKSLKVLINASYGVLGSDRFPLYCLPVADSTTAYGRDSIEKTVAKAKELEIKVLYGDTDSVFLLSPSQKQISEIVEWSQQELGVGLEVEKTYRYIVFSKRKKNYFGVYANSDIDVKGLMGKKRNTPPFLQKAFQEVLEILSNVKTVEEFEQAQIEVKSYVRNVYQKLEGSKYSNEDLAVTMQITQPLKRYLVKSQHVKAAYQLEEHFQSKYKKEHAGNTRTTPFVNSGKFIRFVKTKNKDKVTALELMSSKSRIDVKAYRSMVDTIFEQIFGSLDMELQELASGQINLMEFFG